MALDLNMRADMSKVIVERPRYGSYLRGRTKGWMRAHQRIHLEDWPSRERAIQHDKMLNENLSPLRRFLERNLGRPWNKVYSEISEHLRVDSAVQQHVRDHLRDFVSVHVERQGREFVPKPGTSFLGRLQPFFVHPDSGVLLANPKWGRRFQRPTAKPKPFIKIDATHQVRPINGVWYEIELVARYAVPVDSYDVFLRRAVSSMKSFDLDEAYRCDCIAIHKRQLRAGELRDLQRRHPVDFDRLSGRRSQTPHRIR